MLCINLESTDPYFNLALEEVLLKKSDEEYLILGINAPSVIVGKHQVANREADTQFVTENMIPVIRRISGGGSVFHDPGNLNFTFIRESEAGRQVDFRKHTKPIIDFLFHEGVDARFEGKNDIKVGGLKISGNAEHVYRNRILHHGTLLFSTTLDNLRSALRKDTSSYTSRGVESNPSPVVNIKEMLYKYSNITEFREAMMNYFLKTLPGATRYDLSSSEIAEATVLASTKYKTWDWNWAYGPEYHFEKHFEIGGKQIYCKLFVKEGIITECKITGSSDLAAAADKLIGCRHMAEDLIEVFHKDGLYFTGIDIFKFF